MITPSRAKAHLKKQGWSNRRAAATLCVSQPHLSYVLNGRRRSQVLLARIMSMGCSPTPRRPSGFARLPFRRGCPP
jgi:lambda repressor-like predicted transcriptional regulator